MSEYKYKDSTDYYTSKIKELREQIAKLQEEKMKLVEILITSRHLINNIATKNDKILLCHVEYIDETLTKLGWQDDL